MAEAVDMDILVEVGHHSQVPAKVRERYAEELRWLFGKPRTVGVYRAWFKYRSG